MPLRDGRKKKRDMDNFLEQLKREQAEREERLRYQAERGQSGADHPRASGAEYS